MEVLPSPTGPVYVEDLRFAIGMLSDSSAIPYRPLPVEAAKSSVSVMEDPDKSGQRSIFQPNFVDIVYDNYRRITARLGALRYHMQQVERRIVWAEYALELAEAERNELLERNRDLEQNLRNMKEAHEKNVEVAAELQEEMISFRGQVAKVRRNAQELSIGLVLVHQELSMMRRQARPSSTHILKQQQDDEKKKSPDHQPEEMMVVDKR